MPKAPLKISFFCSAVSILSILAACEPRPSEPATDEYRSANMTTQTLQLSISLPSDFPREKIEEIAHATKDEVDTPGTKLKVAVELEMQPERPGQMQLQIWGGTLPDPQVLVQKLKARFPALAQGHIVAKINEGEPPRPEFEGALQEPDDELARQEIVDRLRAQGIEGDIEVKVQRAPEGDHRKVEVEVRHEQ